MDFSSSGVITTFTASAILLAGVVDDLRSRKVHNSLFLTCTAVAFFAVLVSGGISALPMGALGFVAGIVALLPLVLMGMLGAGDMKLFAAFGMVAGAGSVINVAIYSLIWGALFGVLRAITSGQGKVLIKNMLSIVTLKERSQLELHKMPFTIALLMGWFTQLVYTRAL